MYTDTPIAVTHDAFQMHLIDNLNHFPVNVGPFRSVEVRKEVETFGHLLYRFRSEDAPDALAASGTGAVPLSAAVWGGLSLSIEGATISLAVSPLSLITLGEADREAAGIPKSARRFAFVYPLDENAALGGAQSAAGASGAAASAASASATGEWTCDAVKRAVRARIDAIPMGTAHDEACGVYDEVEPQLGGFLAGGGFVYVDGAGELVRVTSLVPVEFEDEHGIGFLMGR